MKLAKMKATPVILILLCAFLINLQISLAQPIRINEVMASNRNVLFDEDGDTPDWVELYNRTDSVVNLQGWSISDDTLVADRWVFPPVVIPAKGFLLVFMSGKDRKYANPLHADFKLKGGYDPVILYGSDGELVDRYTPACFPSDISQGCKPDGVGNRLYFTRPTPGSTNNFSTIREIGQLLDSLTFSHDAGFYIDSFRLEIKSYLPDTKIYYTRDGSEPSEQSNKYKGPLLIASRKGDPNRFAEIATSPNWKDPRNEVYKTNVIRVMALLDGCPSSKAITKTFFVDKNIHNRYPVSILSISTDEKNLFGKNKGIYVEGDNDTLENYNQHGSEWERPVFLEFFSPDGKIEFRQEIGIRIHGRLSRNEAQKSFRLYTKDKYGDNLIRYEVFPDLDYEKYEGFIIRTTHGDKSHTFFKDELCHEIVKGMDMDFQASRPSVVFVNGEYWGIHNLRERHDKHYIERRHSVNGDNIDLLSLSFDKFEVGEGDMENFLDLLDFLFSNDLSDEHIYEQVEKMIDMDNFIDYYIAQLFFANPDWPESNIRFWRSRKADGKWRWMFYDCDYCLMRDDYNHLVEYIVDDDKFRNYSDTSTVALRKLLTNNEFKNLFYSRFMHHMNTTFSQARINGAIDRFKNIYAPLIPEHIERWNLSISYNGWQQNVEDLKLFVAKRPASMLNHLKMNLGSPFTIVPNPNSGKFRITSSSESSVVDFTIEVYDAAGRQLFMRNLEKNEFLQNNEMDLRGYENGLYYVKIRFGNLLFTEKVVKTQIGTR